MPSSDVAARIAALSAAAGDWREPEYPDREAAVEAARAGDNRCTAEAMAFTLNQRMHTLREETLIPWAADIPQAATPQSVALLDGGTTPLATFHLWVALVLAGHSVRYRPPDAFPALFPAFGDAVAAYLDSTVLTLADGSNDFAYANAVIAKSMSKQKQSRRTFNKPALYVEKGITIAIIDDPDDETWEGLAEDTLLYDGIGDTSPRLLFAPDHLNPDAFLDACAHFRAIYPAHRDTPGRLKMQQAMLKAMDVPHGYSDDLGFLVSKGEAEIQSPGHIRWVPYTSIDDIGTQLPSDLSLIVAPDDVAAQVGHMAPEITTIRPGTAHRPPIEGHTSKDRLLHFLETLAGTKPTHQET